MNPFQKTEEHMQHATTQKSPKNKKETLVRAIFKDASIGIIIVNESGNMQLVNPFALRLFGYSEKELTGKKIEMLLPSRLRKKHIRFRRNYSSEPDKNIHGSGKSDLCALRKGGTEFPVEISLGHYSYDGETYVIAYINDISLKKKEEEEIRQLNDNLEAKVENRTRELTDTLKKLEASRSELQRSLEKEKGLNELKSRFVTMASHEFRTPLSTILSSAYLVEKYCKTEHQLQRKKHIDRIISSVNTLTDILNEFLSVGKIEEGKIMIRNSNLNIQNHVQSIINEISGLLKKGQHISYKHTGEKMMIIDAGILKHIIMNLLSNAIKFSPENSEVVIRTERKGDLLLLSVKDQGIGIPKEDLKRLFERFYRGSNVTNIQGTGLGLHIVFKYVELLNGNISCKSETEKGTKFFIQFRLIKENELTSAQVAVA